MSIVQIRHIANYIKSEYKDAFDFSNSNTVDRNISLALNVFALQQITDCSIEDGKASLIDGNMDNGIDAVYYDEPNNILYVTQSKYIMNGKSEPDLSSVIKFCEGFNDLVSLRFDKFNETMQARKEEIVSILDNVGLRATMLLIHTGTKLAKPATDRLKEHLDANNDADPNWLSCENIDQTRLNNYLTQIHTDHIDIEKIQLNSYGKINEFADAYYGRVSASILARLWMKHGKKILAENIRGRLRKSDVNDQILETIKNEPEKFWYYNNGITIICDKSEIVGARNQSNINLRLDKISIVNGAQTVGSLGEYAKQLDESELEEKLGGISVQVRVIQIKNAGEEIEPGFSKNITKYNNMQNKIQNTDFAAIDQRHRDYRTLLAHEEINYQISRSDDFVKGEKSFDINEAARARCNSMGLQYSLIAHKGVNTYLFKDIDSDVYNAVFNDGLTGIELWNLVRYQRAIDEKLKSIRKSLVDNKDIVTYGKDVISLIFFDKQTINKSSIKMDDMKKVSDKLEKIVQILIPIVVDMEIPPINIFKNQTESKHVIDEYYKK